MKSFFLFLTIATLLCCSVYGQGVTVAVLGFKISSSEDHLDYLADGIPEMLITDLTFQSGITVVERDRLAEIMAEQGLSLSGVVDNEQAAEIGKLLGIDVMILGSLSQVGDQIRLDSHLVRVETGGVYEGRKVRGVGEANIFDLVDRLSEEIVASLLGQNAVLMSDSPRIDVVFVIDSTGSMGDEIGVVRNKIREIVRTVRMGSPPPDVRFAIVDYKDKGDPYLARKFDFSRDTRAILNYLKNIAASGGGDNPESVGAGLQLALEGLAWERKDDVSKMMFLIGDAPPHPREKNLWQKMMAESVRRNISIFTIACSGMNRGGINVFKTIAQKTNGQFNFLTYKQTFVAADGRRRDVLLEGESAFVAEEPIEEKDWAGGAGSFMKRAAGSSSGKKAKVSKEDLGAPSATPEMLREKMASKGWKREENSDLVNNLDSLLTSVIKNKAREKGVTYVDMSDTKRHGARKTIRARILVKNRQREIWIETFEPDIAYQFKRLGEKRATVWLGGQVIPDKSKVNGFYFHPATILINSSKNDPASLSQATVEKISRDVEYYNKYGLMTPNRWFIRGKVIDYRGAEEN